MQKMFAVSILAVLGAADRCGSDATCEGKAPDGRSLLQRVNEVQNMAVETDDDDERKGLLKSLDLDVKVMEWDAARMLKTMKSIEKALGTSSEETNDTSAEETAEETTAESLQQIANETSDDNLKARMNLLETNVADLLSRTKAVETEVGVAQVYLIETTSDPLMGMANRAVQLHIKVHDLQGRIKKMEHTVIETFKPDAALLKKKVEVLEGKVNILKTSVQGTATEGEANTSESSEEAPATSLLGMGSSGEGLKSEVSDLETRMEMMLSTAATLESEVNGGLSSGPVSSAEVLLQKEEIHGRHGLAPGSTGMTIRVAILHAKDHDLQARVTRLEHAVLTGLKPDAELLTKQVVVLEDKVKTLKSRVQGTTDGGTANASESSEEAAAPSLLEIASAEKGLKSQVSDLELRVGELLSTTTALETEVNGPSTGYPVEAALLQEGKADGNHGLVPRVSVLKEKVSNLRARVFKLEHHVTGL